MLTAMPLPIKRQERIQSLLSGSDARWIKKHGRSFSGTRTLWSADERHELIWYYAGQELDGRLLKKLENRSMRRNFRIRSPAVTTVFGASWN